jgi:hypothetical protein
MFFFSGFPTKIFLYISHFPREIICSSFDDENDNDNDNNNETAVSVIIIVNIMDLSTPHTPSMCEVVCITSITAT